MNGHMALYKAVLHNEKNTIPKWFQETLSSYVSIINKCEYSFENHLQNACYLINSKYNCDIIRIALKEELFTKNLIIKNWHY